MFAKGAKVHCLVDITSDDRELGLDVPDPIVPAGTIGTVLGLSREFLDDGEHLKSGAEKSLVVRFTNVTYDVLPEEIAMA